MLHIADDKFIKITYGSITAICCGIIGFAVWMTTMDIKAEANQKSISSLENNSINVNNKLSSIDSRLQRIEILLEQLIEHQKGE